MYIKQFKYLVDNLGYLLWSGDSGMAVDPGAAIDIKNFADQNSIKIKYVTNTHSHHDHTSGNSLMLERTKAEFMDFGNTGSYRPVELNSEKIEIFYTPGHTDDCITFKAGNFLLTGDTLFNGTVGNCFSGDLKGFFNSLKFLMSFPSKTLVYSGHDYVRESLLIAKKIEKDNPMIEEYLERYNPESVVSTIGDELEVNPYLRFNKERIVKIIKDNKKPSETEYDRFKSIMELF